MSNTPRFHPGQQVILLPCPNSSLEHFTGRITTVLEYDPFNNAWRVPFKINGRSVWYIEDHLKPVNDGDEKSSWDECAWQPAKELLEINK